MTKQLLLFFSLLFSINQSFSQADSSRYLELPYITYTEHTENDYKGFENAKLIVDYYYTNGISRGDRYSYEILIIDSELMLAFEAPKTEYLNHVSYQRKFPLDAKQLEAIMSLILSSNLKQLKKGVPGPTASAHTQEVLVVKWKDKGIDISGGMFNLVAFENGLSQKEMDDEMAAERKATSSISGDYDEIFALMKKYFPDLDKLLKETSKH